MQRVLTHAVDQLGGTFDVPDRQIAGLAGLERADTVRHAERVRVLLAGPPDMIAEVTYEAVTALALESGTELWVVLKATEIDAFPQ